LTFKEISDEGLFLKFNPIDEKRIQVVLWDYRFPEPLQFGMVMNLEDENFDAHTLEWCETSLHVGLANFIMQQSRNN